MRYRDMKRNAIHIVDVIFKHFKRSIDIPLFMDLMQRTTYDGRLK